MEKEQQKEWDEAQKIVVSVDLVEAAKQHLKFLAAVDRNRYLYEDHAMKLAIHRYNAFWLPLLAKHLTKSIVEGPLVVPLDCEWIWHCHRLNPIRYKLDCEELYGRILTNHNVISSVQATSKTRTEEVWNKMYPEEPYELDINRSLSEDVLQKVPQNEKFTSYDLISAVKRQVSFTYQVSRPFMSDDLFLQEAEARYKGFLHLIRSNRKTGINRFCVPTYDVDLMWHTHQLHPYYYCQDLINLLGKVLEHDDTDSDRTKGSKLNTGFSETTEQWEETFGKRYWKAGTLNRGSTPTPVTKVPYAFKYEGKEIKPMENCDHLIQLSERKAVEVFLEFVEIKNLPEGYKRNLVVSFSKKHSGKLFNIKKSSSIFSESGEKQVAYLQCEPMGEFLFELHSKSLANKLIPKASKVLGFCCLSLKELLDSKSQLSADKWLLVNPVSGLKISEPILLHVSLSFTPPTQAPQVFHLDQPQDLKTLFNSSCVGALLKNRKVKHARTQTNVTDDDGNVIFSLQMRNIDKDAAKCPPKFSKEVQVVTDSGLAHQVAKYFGGNWVIKGMHELLMLHNNSENDGHLFELVGKKMVKLFSGRRLDFEPMRHGSQRREQDFITAVEFSEDNPYGRAIALFDLKLDIVKAQDEWFFLPSSILGFILSDILAREGYSGFTSQNSTKRGLKSGFAEGITQDEVMMDECDREREDVDACVLDVHNGGCGAGCSGECGTKSSACGPTDCNSLSVVESGGCGGGCGGCGGGTMVKTNSEGLNEVKSYACGGCGGCGGGCGGCGGGTMVKTNSEGLNEVKSYACGGCGGGKCGGDMVSSNVKSTSSACGGCGGCGGGKCGGMVKSASCGGCGAGKCGGGMVSGNAISVNEVKSGSAA